MSMGYVGSGAGFQRAPKYMQQAKRLSIEKIEEKRFISRFYSILTCPVTCPVPPDKCYFSPLSSTIYSRSGLYLRFGQETFHGVTGGPCHGPSVTVIFPMRRGLSCAKSFERGFTPSSTLSRGCRSIPVWKGAWTPLRRMPVHGILRSREDSDVGTKRARR